MSPKLFLTVLEHAFKECKDILQELDDVLQETVICRSVGNGSGINVGFN